MNGINIAERCDLDLKELENIKSHIMSFGLPDDGEKFFVCWNHPDSITEVRVTLAQVEDMKRAILDDDEDQKAALAEAIRGTVKHQRK